MGYALLSYNLYASVLQLDDFTPPDDRGGVYAISGRSRETALILGVQPDWSIDDDVFIV